MKFEFILENEKGNQINFTNTSNAYMTSSIEGLSQPTALISTSQYAGMDGSYMSNAVVDKRNIVINFNMTGINVEKRRQQLYDVVKVRKYIKALYKTKNTDVYSEGYVETCKVNMFDREITGQVSIICADPFWYDSKTGEAKVDMLIDGFKFPFAIEEEGVPFGYYDSSKITTIINNGEETGFLIEILCSGDCINPMLFNEDTSEYLTVTGTFIKGDLISINTKAMHKSITLTRNGKVSNIINKFSKASTWLTLDTGINRFSVHADEGAEQIHATFTYRYSHLGV